MKKLLVKILCLSAIILLVLSCNDVTPPTPEPEPPILPKPYPTGTDYTDPEEYGSSNCYIINPQTEDAEYFIPIENRITEFWTDYADSPVDITSGNWDVELIWHDCSMDPLTSEEINKKKIKIEKVTSGKPQQAIKVSIANDYDNWGNVVVAVVQDGKVLWSWHLWITDYNPDPSALVATAGQGIYAVKNGNVHRYTGDLWESGGIYENRFIMDRNLGMSSANFDINKPYGPGTIYYQFGRKDPFPGEAAEYGVGYSFEPLYGPVDFEWSVNNPDEYYTSAGSVIDWCDELDSNNEDILWNDKKTSRYGTRKSIFDPSPLGWMLPVDGTWDDFNELTTVMTDGGRVYKYADALYPISGYRYEGDGLCKVFGMYGYSWSSTPYSKDMGHLFWGYRIVHISHINFRPYGFPVRPVLE